MNRNFNMANASVLYMINLNNYNYNKKGPRAIALSFVMIISLVIPSYDYLQVSIGKPSLPVNHQVGDECLKTVEKLSDGPIRDLFVANCLSILPILNPADGATLLDDIQRIVDEVT
jgi:hypothetical protein